MGSLSLERESRVTSCSPLLPQGVGLHATSSASFLPYSVSGDTGNAGVGEMDSLPLLVGEKILPSITPRSGGYVVITA